LRTHDTHHPYRSDSSFFYLTGCSEPNSVLLLLFGNSHASSYEEILYTSPNFGFSTEDDRFYASREKGALWVGHSPTPHALATSLGIQAGEPIENFIARMKNFSGHVRIMTNANTYIKQALAALPNAQSIVEQNPELIQNISRMRLCKDRSERSQIRQACAITASCFRSAVRSFPRSRFEYQIEAAILARARYHNCQPGYPSIVAAGAHACILHWTRNHGKINPSDLVLIDAGMEIPTLYTADITRTLPKSGQFTPLQKQIYQAVRAAQQAAFAEIYPGNHFMAPHQAATKVLIAFLCETGILNGNPELLQDERYAHYRRYTLHGTSHMLGLDVHDCPHVPYKHTTLQAGMVLTVEPGLYFQPEDQHIPPAWRGIGVRIEDDVMVTDHGYEVLSDLPRDAEDVEIWMQDIWQKKALV
jgi:Xaa-Pro aminopeptidase